MRGMGDGLLIVYTGGGKGKTTAALGLALRAAGYGRRICMVQFIKGSWHSGEIDSHKRLMPEFEIVRGGEGFVGIIDDKSPREDHERAARATLEEAASRIRSGKYDVVILDEINYAAQMGLVSVQDVLDLAGQRRPGTDLVLTGNHAAPEVVEAADLVTEMREVKHPFQRGIPARKGIDF
ncbi:Cob(I)alamin adenosyltransferase (CobO, btuR) [Nitrosopumilaceae archaeon]|nr:Cob(I)alamin adenosyltransferase (CobO, btuR) [Nitrosopumilaceae archaeon]